MTATERDYEDYEDLERNYEDLAKHAIPSDDVAIFSSGSASTTVWSSAKETWKYRGFISYMTRRHLRITYLRSYLGWFWSLLNPLAEVAIYSFVFGVLLGVNRAVPDAPGGFNSFPHFLLAGLAIWSFYRTVSSKVLNSFSSTVKLRRKLYFPPAAAAFSTAFGTLVEASILVAVVIAFFGVFGHLSIHAIVMIPAALFAAIGGLGVGLGLSVANSRYKDVNYLYSIVLRLGFYLLPIIWPLEAAADRFDGSLEWVAPIIGWNPFARMVQFGRTGILLQEWPSLFDWFYVGGFSFALLYVGWAIFARTSADVAEGL